MSGTNGCQETLHQEQATNARNIVLIVCSPMIIYDGRPAGSPSGCNLLASRAVWSQHEPEPPAQPLRVLSIASPASRSPRHPLLTPTSQRTCCGSTLAGDVTSGVRSDRRLKYLLVRHIIPCIRVSVSAGTWGRKLEKHARARSSRGVTTISY